MIPALVSSSWSASREASDDMADWKGSGSQGQRITHSCRGGKDVGTLVVHYHRGMHGGIHGGIHGLHLPAGSGTGPPLPKYEHLSSSALVVNVLIYKIDSRNIFLKDLARSCIFAQRRHLANCTFLKPCNSKKS